MPEKMICPKAKSGECGEFLGTHCGITPHKKRPGCAFDTGRCSPCVPYIEKPKFEATLVVEPEKTIVEEIASMIRAHVNSTNFADELAKQIVAFLREQGYVRVTKEPSQDCFVANEYDQAQARWVARVVQPISKEDKC